MMLNCFVHTSVRGFRQSRTFAVRCKCESQQQDPWAITYIHRERTSVWTEDNKARLMKLLAARDLQLPMRELEYRLFELTLLLPDLGQRLHTMQPPTLIALLLDVPAVAAKLIQLRELLPTANVSTMVAKQPNLLLQDIDDVDVSLQRLRELLGVVHVDHVVEAEPRFLDVEGVEEVLLELQRLMPTCNPSQVLLGDPSWLLRVERGQKRLGSHPDM